MSALIFHLNHLSPSINTVYRLRDHLTSPSVYEIREKQAEKRHVSSQSGHSALRFLSLCHRECGNSFVSLFQELKVLRRRDGGDAGDRPKLRVDVTALHSDVECRRPGYLHLLCSSQVVARPRRVMARGFVSFVLN